MMSVIKISKLVKYYGKFRALDGIDLEVPPGEVFGFIGPNGAGKSTTIRILLGLLRKNSGDVTLLGGDPWQDAVALHKRLAYVPSDVNLWPNLTGGEVIDLLGRLRGSFSMKRRRELLELFNLDPAKKCRTYSKGNRQKVMLISAFVSDVELLILDEPTSGLDPLMEGVFQECIREAKRMGKTVFLSSHILAEVEKLCDRISIIKEGKIVEQGTLSELRHIASTTIAAETAVPAEGLAALPGVHSLEAEGKRVRLSVDNAQLSTVMAHLAQYGVTALHSAPPTLEELFMRYYANK
ncbi:ATP-binding cassette domain-containing protein [Candidatus Formimonas warabiya]|uniref:ABC transporter ATP-binding protein n=1 Tax=Formimonas warabiya TaxID=1761012 RepID=UPI003AAC39D6